MSVMLRVALLAPPADGVMLTLIAQLAPAFRLPPQVVVLLKSDAFVPPIEMLVMVSVSVPVFDRVTVCAAVVVPKGVAAKLSVVGDRETAGAIPVPERETVCGEEAALSLTLRVAVLVPLAVGLKVIAIEQFAPAARLEPHALFVLKSEGELPAKVTLLIVSVPVPVFVNVTLCDALVVPTV